MCLFTKPETFEMHVSRDWDVVYGENTDCTAKHHGNPNTPIQEDHESRAVAAILVRVSRVCWSYDRWLCKLIIFLTHSFNVRKLVFCI